ncbi:amidohydrolase family protein [Sphingomonas sp. 35-24ZXX]|uniref:amidohydrolase family protein n=1 Tax=Sphingomonas sp. 35-24ZXX TaxID=1545915 RepID=UPI000ADF84DA|nr:amidohydrolase family protein [Sphingomonas sp. 35-24ZXX]
MSAPKPVLRPIVFREAEIADGETCDVLVVHDEIVAVGSVNPPQDAMVVDANGARLLPGLHDHHIHVAASVAAMQSVRCGPPEVTDLKGLGQALGRPGEGWLRGVGYHESVAGLPDRHLLDELASHRPVRVQHRSGRMWFFNSAGLDILLADHAPPPGLERQAGEWTGRLFDEDSWLRSALAATPPVFDAVGGALARLGITGLTEMSPANALVEAGHFAAQMVCGALPQRVVLAGSLALGEWQPQDRLALGPFKLHLHEAHFPDWDETLAAIRAAREQGRGTAVHCVSEAELVFTLGLFAELGVTKLDRIEHGSVIPDALLETLLHMGLPVVVQAGFVETRGDQYLADIPQVEWPWLYRLASLQDAGLVIAGGSDSPYGGADPWAAMRSAVERMTLAGQLFGPQEALSPERALALYLADPFDLGRIRQIEPGVAADLCLLDRPWSQARDILLAQRVRMTVCCGTVVYRADD